MSRIPACCFLPLYLTMAVVLPSCGTASHLLNQAGGVLSSVTSPVLGAVRLSDENNPIFPQPEVDSPEKGSANPPTGPTRSRAPQPYRTTRN